MLVLLHGLLLSSEVAEEGRSTHSVPHERKKVLKRFSFFDKSAMVQLIKCDCSAPITCDGSVSRRPTFVMPS
jgi:hypothetical protein